MTGRFSTSVDLAGFAPDTCPECGRNMALRSGNRSTSTFPCMCPGIRTDLQGRRYHMLVACVCGARFYDPPHVPGVA